MAAKPVKVLIIDDSALVREVLTKIFSRDKNLEVVGSARDPLYAIKDIKEHRPDVITLDLQMPRMDGITFLEKLMSSYPMPVVVISSLAQEGSDVTIKALELGAVDFVPKPALGIGQALDDMSVDIVGRVKNAASVNMDEMRRQVRQRKAGKKATTSNSSPAVKEPPSKKEEPVRMVSSTDKVIAIGASTGGTVAVKNILTKLPANLPGIIVVLHMPSGFTASYAESLNDSCAMKVKEATDGETVMTGYAYIAPGGKHVEVEKSSKGYHLRVSTDPPVNRHRPSADKLFYSVAENAPANSLGIILTGMGNDGAQGLKMMKDRGSETVAQDEKSSIVYGMPKQAVEVGAVNSVLPLDQIADFITGYVKSR